MQAMNFIDGFGNGSLSINVASLVILVVSFWLVSFSIFTLRMESSLEYFAKIADTNWSKSTFITDEKFFRLSGCDPNLKLTFVCVICEQGPSTSRNTKKTVIAYPGTSSNLRSHILVSACYFNVLIY